jgi:hypothetical protein
MRHEINGEFGSEEENKAADAEKAETGTATSLISRLFRRPISGQSLSDSHFSLSAASATANSR